MNELFIPLEIYSLIVDFSEEIEDTGEVGSSILSFFKSCKMFYQHVSLYYYRHTVDMSSNAIFNYFTERYTYHDKLIKNEAYDKDLRKFIMCNTYRVNKWDGKIPLPTQVTRIALSNTIYISIDLSKFVNLTHIDFGYAFNEEIENLPPSVKHVTFGASFNKPIDGKLPASVTHIIFGHCFNKSVDNLPPHVTYLEFGCWFNQPIDKLPPSVTYLRLLSFYFNRHVNRLPSSLVYLEFGIMFDMSVDDLPSRITHLKFGSNFDRPIDNLPRGLKHLTLGYHFNQPINKIPASMVHLELGEMFSKQLVFPLGSKLETLVLNKYYQGVIAFGTLPKSLKRIYKGDRIIDIPDRD